MSLFTSPPSSICILRLSAIGDVCNTVAVVQAIQAHWPTTEITWITGKLEAQLIHDLPHVNVIVFDKKQGWRAYKNLWQQLKSHHFDALLHMQSAIRASLATLGIKATYKLGFDKTRSSDMQHLFTNVKVPSPSSPHVLDGLFSFAYQLGIPHCEPQWSIPYSDEDNAWAKQYLQVKGTNVVIVPGASKAYKNWNADGYSAVIQHAQEKGFNIVLAGSPAQVECDLAYDIEQKLSIPITNLVGQSSIKQMLALLDNADVVIAPDTGPTHMANAMKTPVIGLYAHHNPQRTGPYRFSEFVVTAYDEALLAETGKSSGDVNWRTRIKDIHAMQRISSQSVIAMFDRVIASLSNKS